jgi:hypothetical protein
VASFSRISFSRGCHHNWHGFFRFGRFGRCLLGAACVAAFWLGLR